MNRETILCVLMVLFAIAAAGGLFLATIRQYAGRNSPARRAVRHGLLAGAGHSARR